MDVDDIMQKQVEQLEKEKKELGERLRNQEKKVCVSLSVFKQLSTYLSRCLLLLQQINIMLCKQMSYCS